MSSRPIPAVGWSSAQWRAASSAHRLQVLALLEALGSTTVGTLAELSGRSAQSLYPHLEQLEVAGLVEVRGPQGTAGRSRLYALTDLAKEPPVDPSTGVGHRHAMELAAMMLHEMCARLRRYGGTIEGQPSTLGPARRKFMRTELTWLDDARRMRLNQLLEEAMQIIRDGRDSKSGVRTNVVMYHFPDVTLREARESRPSKSPPPDHRDSSV